jgi:hypothetical protein
MLLVVAGVVGFLAFTWLVLFTVRQIRPETFRLKATVTKWISLDLEIRSPQRSDQERLKPPGQPRRRLPRGGP